MSYRAPVADMLFVMKELAGLEAVARLPGFEEAGLDTAQAVLEECARFNEQVKAYNKKQPLPQMRHIDYGLSAYRADCLANFIGSDLSDLQSALAESKQLAGFEVNIPYHEIGSPAGLKALEEHLQQSRL